MSSCKQTRCSEAGTLKWGRSRLPISAVLPGGLFCLAQFLWISLAAQPQSLLIQGGTLIDGSGRPPLENANIFIQEGVIRRIWSGDEDDVPADTVLVDAQGKYIIPGLIDSHVHYREYMGELFLAYGVTAVYDLGNPFYWQTAVKKGLNEGHIRGPRFYFCGRVTLIEEGRASRSAPLVRSRDVAVMRGPQQAAEAVAILDEKTDCVKLDEFMAQDIFESISVQAQAAGRAIISHSLNAVDSANWGIDGIEHMTGIAIATIRSPEGRRALEELRVAAGHKNSFLYQWMEPAYFDEVITALVSRNVFINPTLHFEWKALTQHSREHELEDARLLNHPDLQYVPLSERLVFLGQYHWADDHSLEEKQKFVDGYGKVQQFLGRFVKAGGKIYSGTDTAAALTPGLSLHHEMELLVDAGLTPLQTLQSSTLWAAEILGLQDRLGSIEEGKLADLVILRADPLANIRNTKTIEQVILGGKVIDTSFHSDYQFPFRRYGPESKHLYNPPPIVTDVVPPVTEQGSLVELRIQGTGFVRSSVIRVAELTVPTRWVSAQELAATLHDSDTASVGTLLITVESPLPGGGVSEPVEFYVTYP